MPLLGLLMNAFALHRSDEAASAALQDPRLGMSETRLKFLGGRPK